MCREGGDGTRTHQEIVAPLAWARGVQPIFVASQG